MNSVFFILTLVGCNIATHAGSHVQKKNLLAGLTRRVIKSPGVGGQGGSSFDDRVTTPPLQDFVTINAVQKISVSYGDYLESMQVTYRLSNDSYFQAPRCGRLSSSEVVITLAYSEYLMKVEGYHNGTMVQQITFTTLIYGYDNKSTHTYGPYGNAGNTSFSVDGFVVGFYGRCSEEIVNLGIYTLAFLGKSEEFGGGNVSGLTYFDDKPDEYYAPVSRMNVLYVYHGDAVDAIRTLYTVLNGNILQTYRNGGPGGTMSTISLTMDEAIIGVEGSTEGQYINQIKFITQRQQDGSVRGYGPFGKAASKEFSFYGNILGFSGSFNNFLHSFSVYYS